MTKRGFPARLPGLLLAGLLTGPLATPLGNAYTLEEFHFDDPAKAAEFRPWPGPRPIWPRTCARKSIASCSLASHARKWSNFWLNATATSSSTTRP